MSSSSRNPIRLGFVGFGEIGYSFSKGLTESGLQGIHCYDPMAFGGKFQDVIAQRAEELSVTLVRSPEELAERCDVILSATPGAVSVDSARKFAGVLAKSHLFCDLASSSPRVKQNVAEQLKETGAEFVDGSIVGPGRLGYTRKIVASGKNAKKLAELLNPWGMDIEVVSSEIGAASAIKILRSVIMKGMEGLVVECLLGARRYGIDARVIETLETNFSRPFSQLANGLTRTNAIHAARRAQEVDMSAETLADIGIEPIITRAVAERMRWVADLGLKEYFGGVVPEGTYDVPLGAIERKLEERTTASEKPES